MKLSKKLIVKIEAADFTVSEESPGIYDFGKYSPAGQDFHFSVETGKNYDCFQDNILAVYYAFDVSEEAYLWLDNFGHGKNGAPHDMKDVVEDMEASEEFIFELFRIVSEYRGGK